MEYVSGSLTEDPSASFHCKKAADDTPLRLITANVHSIGISLVDDGPKELLYLCMEGVQVTQTQYFRQQRAARLRNEQEVMYRYRLQLRARIYSSLGALFNTASYVQRKIARGTSSTSEMQDKLCRVVLAAVKVIRQHVCACLYPVCAMAFALPDRLL
jgi:hypothetical protein